MIFNSCEEHTQLDSLEPRDCNYCQQCKTWEHKETCYAETNRKQEKKHEPKSSRPKNI